MKWFECYPTPLEAQALGSREAIVWLGEFGPSMVQNELNCKIRVDELNSNSQFDFVNIMS